MQVTVVVVVLSLVVGQVLGQPVLLGHVTSGSMEPAISAGDGFVAIPGVVAGEPSEGDVIVFESTASTTHGELTTHRVVGETEEGYVTQGDANPFTDQDDDEEPVQDDQVVATALQIDDTVVTIPHLGTAVQGAGSVLETGQRSLATATGTDRVLGTTGLALVVFALSVALLALEHLRGRSTQRGRRRPSVGPSNRTIAVGLAVLVAGAGLAAMVVPAGDHTYDVISAEFDSENPLVIEQGGEEQVDHEIANTGIVPAVSYFEAGESAAVSEEAVTVGPLAETEATVTLSAPSETGHYPTTVTEHRYLLVLPPDAIAWLHDQHPFAPVVVITGLLGGLTYAVVQLATGTTHTGRTSTRTGRGTHR